MYFRLPQIQVQVIPFSRSIGQVKNTCFGLKSNTQHQGQGNYGPFSPCNCYYPHNPKSVNPKRYEFSPIKKRYSNVETA